jgi:hypothetical protein
MTRLMAFDDQGTVVNLGVMTGTQRDQVVEVGGAPGLPVIDVVDVAPIERCVAVGFSAAAVLGEQSEALRLGGEAAPTSQVQQDAVGVEHGGNHATFTGQLASGLR